MQVELEKPEYANMRLVRIAYGDDEPQKSYRETEGLLAAFPNLRGIISPTTVGLAAAAQALETNDAADRVALTGLGLPNQMRSYVKNGTVTAFQLWDPSEMGYAAVYLVDAIRAAFVLNPARRIKRASWASVLLGKQCGDRGVPHDLYRGKHRRLRFLARAARSTSMHDGERCSIEIKLEIGF